MWCRIGLLVVLSGLVTGCGTDPAASQPWRTISALWEGGRSHLPTPQQLARLPYAAVFVKVGDGPAGMMVLAQVESGYLEWASGDRVWLQTKSGRITGLANWPVEIVGFRASGPDPLPHMHRQPSASYRYELDLMPGYRARLPFEARLHQVGLESVQVGYRQLELLHVQERVTSSVMGFEAVNHYWLDPVSGKVLKSLQSPAPGLGPIQIDVVKPYVGG